MHLDVSQTTCIWMFWQDRVSIFCYAFGGGTETRNHIGFGYCSSVLSKSLSSLCIWSYVISDFQKWITSSVQIIQIYQIIKISVDYPHFKFCLSGVAFWMQTGERQTARMRVKYLQSVLRKDINFFDTEARDENIIFHISSDAILVQDAIGDKV